MDYYIERNGKYQRVKRQGFALTMATYFTDAPLIKQKILDGKYKYGDMERIVREYNNQTRLLNDNNEQN